MKHYLTIICNRYLPGFSAKRIKKIMAIILSMLIFTASFCQSGALKGRVTDKETNEKIPFANILLLLDSTLCGGTQTDFDGNFTIKPIEPGLYELKATYVGYKTTVVKGIKINADQITFYDIEIEYTAESLPEIVVTDYKIPLINRDMTCSGGCVTSKEINKMPGRSSGSIATCIGGLYSSDGENGNVRGARINSTVMYIDGIRVVGTSEIPHSSVEPTSKATSDKSIKTEVLPVINNEKFMPGQLTAGEINDFSKWEMWKDISGDELKQYQNLWDIKPKNRYCVQVMTQNGFPVVGCVVKLLDGKDDVIWTSKTDNTGKAEVWAGLFESKSNNEKKYSIKIKYGNISKRIKRPKLFHKGINSATLNAFCNTPDNVDILFAVDATGSMGDEIRYLKAELKDVIEKFSVSNPDLKLRMGSVFYRDEGDEYITKKSDFSADIQQTIDFIAKQNAGGGGDTPEAVDKALEVSINSLSWSENARARLVFLILDAPPHSGDENITRLQQTIDIAAETGIKIIPITGSGINKSAEYLMRAIALATNGTYIFLTDDSGIGGKHTKPSIDDYEVELLNDLITRLLLQFTYVEDCNKLPVPEENQDLINTDIVDQFDEMQPKEQVKESDTSKDADDAVPGVPEKTVEKIWIKSYPNPTSGIVNIEHSKKVKEIFVVDISGKILQRYNNYEKDLIKVDLSEFPNGMYFLKYANVDHWEYAKIILTH